MKIRWFLKWCAIFLVSLMVSTSCTPSQTTSSNPTSAPNATAAVKIGFSAWPGWFPWQVAKEKEIFTVSQVNVDLKWFDGYTDSINALSAGQLDANAQTLNDTISPIAAGADLVVVLTNDNSTGNDKIIVRDGINSIADLKGKKVAVEEGTVDHFLLLLGLQKAGLTQKDILFQPLETGQAAAAFVAGKVDAVGVFAPFTTQAQKRAGSRELFSSKDFPGAISDHLVFNRKFVNEHPAQVQAVVDSWFETLKYVEKNREAAIAIMAKRGNVTPKEYEDYDKGTRIFNVDDNLKAFEPGQNMTSLPFAAQKISQFLLEAKLVKSAPDLSKVFDDRFVKAYAAKTQKPG